MARPNVARIESGRHAPSTDTLIRIATALGVSLASLVRVPRPDQDSDDVALAESGVDEWNDDPHCVPGFHRLMDNCVR
jgi:transcriptional regulator with XRE-family HTH domain